MTETTAPAADFVFLGPLDRRHARGVAAIERRLHRPSQREGVDEFRGLLHNAAEAGANLSLGLFDRGRLVGYLVAYVRERGFLGGSADEPVVYVHDVAVLPRYSSGLRRLLRRAAQSFQLLVPDLPVEAHFASPEHKLSRLCTHVMRQHGYGLEESREQSDPAGREGMKLAIRWNLDPETLQGKSVEAPAAARVSGQRVGNHDIEVVTTQAGFLALRDDWQRLVERLDDTTVFHFFDYQWQTWLHLGTSNSLYILVVRKSGEITGIAPLELRPRRAMGGCHRELALIGTPWQVERSRLLVDPADTETLDSISSYLLDHRETWEMCTLWELSPEDALMQRFLDNFSDQGLLLAATPSSTCPFIDLRGSWQDYLAGRSRRLRKNLRRSRRQLESLGRLELRQIRDWPEAKAGMADYLTVEENSWKADRGIGIGRSLWSFGYYESLAHHYCQRGEFDLRLLTLDDRPIAATFGIRDRGTFYSMRIAHDRAFNPYSPGTLLEAMELEALFATDLDRYDPLGGFLTNKLRWADSAVDTVTLHVCSPTWRLRAFYTAYFKLKPAARSALKKMGLFEAAQDLQRRIERYRSGRAKKIPGES